MALFEIGDYGAGMLMGIATALALRALTWPRMGMVIAILIGVTIGTVLHP